MNNPWYQSVEPYAELTQGDLIFACPVFIWKEVSLVDDQEDEVLRSAADVVRADVIVMTQACDLEHSKVDNVLLCPHISIEDYREQFENEMHGRSQNPTQRAWKKRCDSICEGFIWNLSMINPCVEGPIPMSHRIVDFHNVFTVPRLFLESLLKRRKESRIRLLPPYREYLSQAFARFFMRVGLPVELKKGW